MELLIAALITIIIMLIPKFAFFILDRETWMLVRKIKREYRNGEARISCYEYGAACHTMADIAFSGGKLSTTCDPVTDQLFGIYKIIKCDFNTDGINLNQLARKVHSFAYNVSRYNK